MIIRQTMGGTRKEDKIRDKDELIERIKEEYDMQNSKTTHKLNLTMLDVSKVEDMNDIFSYYEYDNLEFIDVSTWDVGNVEDMGYMFYNCSSLKSIDVSKWDVSNVVYMSNMFEDCSSLESIDVSNWDVSNVRNMSDMFKDCKFDYKKEGNRLIRI